MKTSESFFPTRTNIQSPQPHKDHTVQLIRPKERSLAAQKTGTQIVNIFKDKSDPPYRQEAQNPSFRPIGGLTLFKKTQHHRKQSIHDLKKGSKRSNKDNTLRNIVSGNGSRFRKERAQFQELQDVLPLKSINQNRKPQYNSVEIVDQTFQSHNDYQPTNSASKLRTHTAGATKSITSENKTRPKTSKLNGRYINRRQSQTKEYQDKSALLNEINYNKPLVQRYGEHYFEFMLRNRFQQDLKPSPYIYLLGRKQFANTKAINRIKNQRPDIRERQMLVLRGKKIHTDVQDL